MPVNSRVDEFGARASVAGTATKKSLRALGGRGDNGGPVRTSSVVVKISDERSEVQREAVARGAGAADHHDLATGLLLGGEERVPMVRDSLQHDRLAGA